MNIKLLQQRWRTARDAFFKTKASMKNQPSGSSAKKFKKYIYYDELMFLNPSTDNDFDESMISSPPVNEASPENVTSPENTESLENISSPQNVTSPAALPENIASPENTVTSENTQRAKRFITEVQNRLCLWNLKEKSYSDRPAKRRAWEEIAEILLDEWETYDTKTKNESIADLQKKWKHLRDYYVRERKKSPMSAVEVQLRQRERKTPYVEMLRFLDVVREMRPTTSNLEDKFDETSGEENQLQETGSESSNSNSKPGSRKTQSMTLFQRSLINSMEKSSQDDNDSDKQFLLSLLPQMKKMSEAQNFDFRLDVMNL
ncbi:hypothetical protein HW555_013216, partial [Spodoptera exigua]